MKIIRNMGIFKNIKKFRNVKIKTRITIGFLACALIVGTLNLAQVSIISTLNDALSLEIGKGISIIVFLAVSVALAFLCGLIISQGILRDVGQVLGIVDKLAEGDVDIQIETNQSEEIAKITKSLEKIAHYIKDRAYNIARIANGDFTFEIDKMSDKDALTASIQLIMQTLQALQSEMEELTDSAVQGELSTRGNADGYNGGYSAIVQGVNDTLDAVIAPIDEAKAVLGKMAENDYTYEMQGQYKGAMEELANSINAVRKRLLSIQDIFLRTSNGDNSKLEEMEEVGRRSENDLMIPAAIGMQETIESLIKEVNMISESAISGDLSVRGDSSKFKGQYREIIDGLNNTMDAITGPMHEVLSVLEEMAKNNLEVSMKGEYSGDYDKIKQSLNGTIKSFNHVLNEIASASQQVASGARQVSDSSQVLSQGSSEQASSIQQLTASMEEIAAQTKHNAENADRANELSLTAKEDVIHGNERMKEMLQAMSQISEASMNISKIIKVIDDIAFQTNILALNAAVEAARAGQHGKGFAVVAEEVRNLAAKSANAAKDTTVLIESSVKKSESGTKIASETAEALKKIMDGISKSAELVAQIASSSNEQAAAIEQVNLGINQVSQVTQTNSATSEEGAAASEELTSQSESLEEMVGKFKLQKASDNTNKIEGLSPEILRALEKMGSMKKDPATKYF